MEMDIKCSECGKGTRNFELGEMLYLPENVSETLIVKNDIMCPKCRKDISDEKCLVKTNELLMRLVTANICLSLDDVPKHLQGAYPLRKRDYEMGFEMERIERIIITEGKVKANLKRTICNKCGRLYFMAIAKDGSIIQPCPVCLGLFDVRKKEKRR